MRPTHRPHLVERWKLPSVLTTSASGSGSRSSLHRKSRGPHPRRTLPLYDDPHCFRNRLGGPGSFDSDSDSRRKACGSDAIQYLLVSGSNRDNRLIHNRMEPALVEGFRAVRPNGRNSLIELYSITPFCRRKWICDRSRRQIVLASAQNRPMEKWNAPKSSHERRTRLIP